MDNRSLAVLKGLALDIIQNARGGYPGSSLSAAPIIYTLYTKHMNINPSIFDWINRDRFVLSAGHASALLYATLFLSGFQFNVEDLKNYRRLNSKTPSNPELGTIGVDASTGMLGEGFATAVGIALGERILEERFNKKPKNAFDKKTKKLIDYYTYVLASDGDLMEGISYEASSFAGNLKLNKLIVLYDANKSSMDTNTNKNFTESISYRFSAFGWNVINVKNGKSISEINKAIVKAKKNKFSPTLIIVNTTIGDGSKLEGTPKVHSGELTKDDYEQLKKGLGVEGLPFTILKEPAENIRNQITQRGIKKYDEWEKVFDEYKKDMTADKYNEFQNLSFNNNSSIDLTKIDFNIKYDLKETLRESNSIVMNVIADSMWNFIGGASDVATATLTYLNGKDDIAYNNFKGRNILYGTRENASGAISNGLAISGFRPFASTFMAFSDYMKPSVRMSAIMNLPVTYIFTHDSITVGADGPTHQPIEQLASLRATPNLYVYRPADLLEIIGTWNCILKERKPAVISLAKTEVKVQDGTNMLSVSKGAYIEADPGDIINVVIIATGAEVQVANSIKEKLKAEGIGVRVVSMPCMEKFLEQTDSYKDSLFPAGAKIFVLEYESSFGWEKFVTSTDYLLTISEFGKSASKEEILKYYKLDLDSIIERIKSLI